MTIPCTQITYLSIAKDKELSNPGTEAGKQWSRALDILEQYDGFIRLYYGRSPEDPTKVQLHVVREYYSQHQEFAKSPSQTTLLSILTPLLLPKSQIPPLTRHAHLQEHTPNSKALGRSASAFNGTAIYIDTDDAWHLGAWPLWTHIVRHVDGCQGVTGGRLVEAVGDDDHRLLHSDDGQEKAAAAAAAGEEGKEGKKGGKKRKHHNCFLVYVAWESVEKHDAYHHTAHFANRRVVLALGNKGWKEYGHVVFEGARENEGWKPRETQTSKFYKL